MSSINSDMGAYVVVIAPEMALSCEDAWNACGSLYTKALSVSLGMKVTLTLQEVPSADTSGAEFSVKTLGLDVEVALFLEAYMAALACCSHVEGLPVWKATGRMQPMPCPHVLRVQLGSKQGLHTLTSRLCKTEYALQLGPGAMQAYLTHELCRIRDQTSVACHRCRLSMRGEHGGGMPFVLKK